MAKTYCTIAVEIEHPTLIVSFLQSHFGISFKNESSELTLGLHFHVYEAPREWLYGLDSLGSPLPEEDAFYSEFNVSTFKIFVDLFCSRDSVMADCLHVVADAVGKAVSKGINKRTLVMLDGTHFPFRLYEQGEKVDSFPQYFEEYIRSRPWLPSGE